MTENHRVLLVTDDDDAGLHRALIEAAPDAGVAVAKSREEMLRTPEPHLVVLDTDSAADLLQWMRTHPVYRKTPVIALTASPARAAIEHLYELGANTCLRKPLDPISIVGIAAGIGTYAGLVRTPAR